MDILKSKWFNKWAKKTKIPNESLVSAISKIELNSVIDLGSGLYKIRVPRENQGKSGGFRTLVIYRKDNLALFILGFAKSERDNIGTTDLADLKTQAKYILSFKKGQIEKLIENGTFIKVNGQNEK